MLLGQFKKHIDNIASAAIFYVYRVDRSAYYNNDNGSDNECISSLASSQ